MKGAIALRKPTQTAYYDLSGGAIGTSSWVVVLTAANNLYACSAIEIFNPTGSTMKIAIGAAGSEVTLPYTILPGGTTGLLACEIKRNTAVSLKSVDASSGSAGIMILNQFG